jgi:predicted HNH restriction endonuclease
LDLPADFTAVEDAAEVLAGMQMLRNMDQVISDPEQFNVARQKLREVQRLRKESADIIQLIAGLTARNGTWVSEQQRLQQTLGPNPSAEARNAMQVVMTGLEASQLALSQVKDYLMPLAAAIAENQSALQEWFKMVVTKWNQRWANHIHEVAKRRDTAYTMRRRLKSATEAAASLLATEHKNDPTSKLTIHDVLNRMQGDMRIYSIEVKNRSRSGGSIAGTPGRSEGSS